MGHRAPTCTKAGIEEWRAKNRKRTRKKEEVRQNERESGSPEEIVKINEEKEKKSLVFAMNQHSMSQCVAKVQKKKKVKKVE